MSPPGLGPGAEHALISLLALNGLRVSEAIGANIEALGAERGHRTLTVLRRGGKTVTIPLAPRKARAVDLAVGERAAGPIFTAATDGVSTVTAPLGSSDESPSEPGSPGRSAPTHPPPRLHHRRPRRRRALPAATARYFAMTEPWSPHRGPTATLVDAMGGPAAVVALAHAWHARCLADPILAHAFHDGVHPEHAERLAAYWCEQLGGPPGYTELAGGHADVVRMHSGNGPHEQMDGRGVAAFAAALDDVGIPTDPALRFELIAWSPGPLRCSTTAGLTQAKSRRRCRCRSGTGAAPTAGKQTSMKRWRNPLGEISQPRTQDPASGPGASGL